MMVLTTSSDGMTMVVLIGLAITKTCKEIGKESLGIFYSINTFTFYPRMWCFGFKMTREQMRSYSSELSTLRQWLKRIGKENAASLKNLVLDLGEWDPFADRERWLGYWPPVYFRPKKWNREWWQMARKLERKILHPYLEPECIKICFNMRNVPEETLQTLTTLVPAAWNRPEWLYERTTYLLSATDKGKAAQEIRRLCELQKDALDKDLRQSRVDLGSQIRPLLRSAIELNRDLMLNAVGEEVKKQDLSDRLAALSLT